MKSHQMGTDEDILQEIPDEDLPLLCELYNNQRKTAPHVYSFLMTYIAWKVKKPHSNYMTLYGLDSDWLKTGTFILLMQFNCYDLFVYTLEENCKGLRKGLSQTKRIDWSRQILWYGISDGHVSVVENFLKQLGPPSYKVVTCELMALEKEAALEYKFECPSNVYLERLNKSHAPLIDSVWPHRTETTVNYLEVLIEMNNSYGLFLKSNDSLVCWVLRNLWGQMCNLQTLEEHKKKGYATLITKAMAKQVAEDGFDSVVTIVHGNLVSKILFEKLGFRVIGNSTFLIR